MPETRTRLYLIRTRSGKEITQKDVARAAGISLRTYEALEQGLRDINKTQAFTVFRLALALKNLTDRKYTVEDLLEIQW